METQQNSGCQGYWVNVQAHTYAAPPAYKCLTQAEYDAFNMQYEQANAYDMHLLGICLLFIVVASVIAVPTFYLVRWSKR